jgi:hypothetical protein
LNFTGFRAAPATKKKPDDKLLMSHNALKMNIQLHYTPACPGAFALDGYIEKKRLALNCTIAKWIFDYAFDNKNFPMVFFFANKWMMENVY